MIEINSLTLEETRDLMESLGEKPYRGDQVFSYINKNKIKNIGGFTGLSKDLRTRLSEISYYNKIDLYKKYDSKLDKTSKFLFQLEDKNIIESVFMSYSHGNSACISTQVGCKMGCSFCASTKMGLVRNLSPGEMAGQIYEMEDQMNQVISNLVLMGSGEPLDNYDNTINFIKIISDNKGKDMSLRNISLSTCGLVDRIYDLAKERLPITLSISLHSPFDDIRGEMMPVGKKYKVEDLITACYDYYKLNSRRITFEYTLIAGVNNRDEDIKEIERLFRNKDMQIHFNLIPLNPIKEFTKDRPDVREIKDFQKKLKRININSTIRKEMGGDISASCGQLRRSIIE